MPRGGYEIWLQRAFALSPDGASLHGLYYGRHDHLERVGAISRSPSFYAFSLS